MNKIVYIRPSLAEEDEVEALRSLGIPYTLNRAQIPPGSRVIGRYSVLPYYQELVSELKHNGSELVNSYADHQYVADLGSYAYDLGDLTPQTWSSMEYVSKDTRGMVLKGATNSKKHQWNTHMYADTWQDAMIVFLRLSEDSLIGTQHIYIRKYVPLVSLGRTMTGLPITKEFRFFVFNGHIVSSNFYWSSFNEDIVEQGYTVPSVDEVPAEFMKTVIDCLSPNVLFYAVDVAQDDTNRWWVIDVNDGQMSGLSGIDPVTFYQRLMQLV